MQDADDAVLQIEQGLKNGKKIACFGAGNALRTFCTAIAGKDDGKIWRIVDNDQNKWGKVLRLPIGEYEVLPPRLIEDADIVVITCNASHEIIRQIRDMEPQSKSLEVFSYMPLVLEMSRHPMLPTSFRVTREPIIPKVIHYCWFGGEAIPLQCQKYMESWKKYCPDYEIVRWDESNYDVEKNQYMCEAYKAKSYGFVSDYARLDIVYNHGGIYLDVDVELVKSLDDFLYEKGFMAFHFYRVSTGLGFGAVPSLPIIKKIRDDYERQTFVPFDCEDEAEVKKIKKCPDIQTEFLEKIGLSVNGFT